MENSPYMESIVAHRAMLLDDEEALAGNTTISLETQGGVEEDIVTYIQENFENFIKLVRYLSLEDQEILLGYYLLGKSQNMLGQIHKMTQTTMSFRLRRAVKCLGTFIMLGVPDEATLYRVFVKTNVEDILPGHSLSEMVWLYSECRSFAQVADALEAKRPDIRRSMSNAHKALMALEQDTEAQAIGAYIHALIDKASASGQGLSDRKMRKMGNLQLKDPDILGEYVIDLTHPDFGALFTSRANR